jgi:glucokinase
MGCSGPSNIGEAQNSRKLNVNLAGKYAFGVDLGGTTVKLGYFTKDGKNIEKWEITTNTNNCGENILPDIANAIKNKMKEKNMTKADVVGVGIGVPGPVDNQGIIYGAVNLGWGTFNIEKKLSSLLDGMAVKAGNDANVAALGEMWQGGGKGHTNVVAVTLGTGVGGGIIVKGEIVAGSTGAGGEVGHIHLNDDETDTCGCGNKGCLEQYASATGVVRLANKALQSGKGGNSSLAKLDKVTAKDVWDAAKAGDSLGVEIAETYGKYLGKGLAAIADVCNPTIFVIGGGVSNAGDVLITYANKYFQQYAFKGCRGAKIVLSVLGNDSGIYGAAKMVLP